MPEQPDPINAAAPFVSLLTEHQADISAFLISMLPGHPDVADILQKTNLVLWKKQEQFTPGTNFRAWAFKIARFEMLHHLRTIRNERFVAMDEELTDIMAGELEVAPGRQQARLEALDHCLTKLRPEDRQLLEHRYRKGTALDELAAAWGRTVSSLSVSLHRLRAALKSCISKSINSAG